MELINLFILTIFSGINIFEYDSYALTVLFIVCGKYNNYFHNYIRKYIIFLIVLLWYGLYCMYSFYVEMAEYNNPVKSGAIEISYNANINPLMQLPEKAIENTAV